MGDFRSLAFSSTIEADSLFRSSSCTERTIPGTMDDLELAALFTGYGYQVRIVEYGATLPPDASELDLEISVNQDMAASMAWAYGEIRNIQNGARTGKAM